MSPRTPLPGTNRTITATTTNTSIAAARWGKLLAIALLLGSGQAASQAETDSVMDEPQGHVMRQVYTIPLFMSASNTQGREGFVRLINRSEQEGTVSIHAIDDTGQRFGPVTLSLGATQTTHFNSGDLERGNPSKGLSGGVGSGEGNWRLELETDLDIEPLAYIRTTDGFLTSMHDVVAGESMRWHVPIFNPGRNRNQLSLLRVINTSGIETSVVIEGLDDQGAPPRGSEVSFTLPADGALTLSAEQLEQGSPDFKGRFGAGEGKWQLFVSAEHPIQVMSLLSSPAGHLTNLSSVMRDDVIRGGPGPDRLRGGNGNDTLDPGGNNENWDIVYGSGGDDTIVYTDSGSGYQELHYIGLDTDGITATIDGLANRATVDKGAAGTDTIVNIANPLNASGFGIFGTRFDDVFDVGRAGAGNWIGVEGNAGKDTFDIQSGGDVVLLYSHSPIGVDIDLSAGTVHNDGFGHVDIINGSPAKGVQGSEFSDVITGSDNDEWFYASAGDDIIDGGDGRDRLIFISSRYADIGDLDVDLESGTATGVVDGNPFSYTLSNFEEVRGQDGDDMLRGNAVDNWLDGGNGNDIIHPGDNADIFGDFVRGSIGDDRIIYTDTRKGYHLIYYSGLNDGIRVTIDELSNRATVDKGAAGTDTIVDYFINPLNDDYTLAIYGTNHDDVFDVVLDNQGMQIAGGPGNDTFILDFMPNVSVRLIYNTYDYCTLSTSTCLSNDRISRPLHGIDIDLGAGKVYDDGFGHVDTIDMINGYLPEVMGTDFKDRIIGSDNDESFICRGGDDVIDGGGGTDQLRFDRYDIGASVDVDLEAGTAMGSWNGSAFSYAISNIERVRGTSYDDTFRDSAGDDTFVGHGGRDTFIFEHGGNDEIWDFTDGDDLVVFIGLGLSHSDVIGASTGTNNGGVWIDLSRYGRGTITLPHFDIDDWDASDFLL